MTAEEEDHPKQRLQVKWHSGHRSGRNRSGALHAPGLVHRLVHLLILLLATLPMALFLIVLLDAFDPKLAGAIEQDASVGALDVFVMLYVLCVIAVLIVRSLLHHFERRIR